MRFSQPNDVRAIARELKKKGHEPAGMTYGDELEDADIDFGFDVSVQVGETYVSVNTWDEAKGTMSHHPVATLAEASDVLGTELGKARKRSRPPAKPSGA